MLRFLVRRVLAGAVTVLLASFVIFAIIHLLPGDEVRALMPPGTIRVPRDVYDRLSRILHLDRPLLVQYGYFLRDFVTLDFGRTMPHVSSGFRQILPGDPIRPMIVASLQVSAGLVAGVVALQVALAPAIAWLAARRPKSWPDLLSRGSSVILVAIPVLGAAIMIQTTFSYWTDLSPSPKWSSRGTFWQNYGPPILSLGIGSAAHLALVGREEAILALVQPHAKFARAIGLPESRIVRRAMRPTAARMIQVFGANVAAIGTGLIIVEDIFGVPGLGTAMLDAIHEQDRILIVTLLMVVLVLAIIASTLADIVHAALDPRVREAALTGRRQT